ncbi:MAG: homoserine kinase [Candidatus Melainabacteria bacterium GWF2_32_7]|nr:MAG: homoserine kinase [Candidatus Melainabacteria bacterium GWF2_32_7]
MVKVSVKVPATTANLGPGFDCFGIALSLYNVITVEETVYPTTGLQINILGEEEEGTTSSLIPTNESNVIYKAIELLYNYTGQTPPALRINIQSNIPIAKGLGSSASVIMGGVLAANQLLGNPADEAALLSVANEVEGHPDNITPAMLGGFVLSSAEDDGSIIYRKVDWPQEWKLTVCIPDYELATQISRSVLPQTVNFSDAAFNAKRCAMFIEALHSKDDELMKYALTDRLHQPYRSRLVPGYNEIKENLKEIDILGTVISGAGPSILVISRNNVVEEIKEIVSSTWEVSGINSAIKTIDVDIKGAVIL